MCNCVTALGNFFFHFCRPCFSVFKVSIHTSSRSEIVFSPNLLISLPKALFVSVQCFLSLVFLFGSSLGFPSLCSHHPSVLACCLLNPLEQWSPASLAPGTGFMEDSFPMDLGMGWWFWDVLSPLHLLYT